AGFDIEAVLARRRLRNVRAECGHAEWIRRIDQGRYRALPWCSPADNIAASIFTIQDERAVLVRRVEETNVGRLVRVTVSGEGPSEPQQGELKAEHGRKPDAPSHSFAIARGLQRNQAGLCGGGLPNQT